MREIEETTRRRQTIALEIYPISFEMTEKFGSRGQVHGIINIDFINFMLLYYFATLCSCL